MIRSFLTLVLALLAFQASAQVHQTRGQFTLNYKEAIGTFDRKEVPSSFKQKARQEAELKAIERYFAEAGQAASANFGVIRERFLQNPDQYILDSTVISEEDASKDFRYTVVVRVSLNVANLRNAMQAESAVGQASAGEKSALSFVFVSRQVSSTKSFDDRVYKREDSTASYASSNTGSDTYNERTREGESIGRSHIGTSGQIATNTSQNVSVNEKASVTSETGGSTTARASESSWRVMPSANLNQVFIAQFSQAGYDVIEAAMVDSPAFTIGDIESDYKSGNDLQPKTLRSVASGMRAAEIPYIALGTLDVGLPGKDPQSGLFRVSVTVNAKIWDVTKNIPRTRVAVGPVAYSGVGPTEDEARGNALKSAASSAAQELSSRMAASGLH